MVARVIPPTPEPATSGAEVRGWDFGEIDLLEADDRPGLAGTVARVSRANTTGASGAAVKRQTPRQPTRSTPPSPPQAGERVFVLGSPIDVLDWQTAVDRIEFWASRHQSTYVAICNSHSVVTAGDDAQFAQVLAEADMATADGMPVAWMMRRLGHPEQQRINGPDLMLRYCEHAARTGTSIYLYGSTDPVLELLVSRLQERYPGLKIAGHYSPPFRPLTDVEDAEICRKVAESGAGVVFVSLGCPKQEKWMHAHRGRIPAVMIGVGAAFDYHAGTLSRAPAWMRNHGLEWLHRLVSEPRRLWKRYLVTNSLFMVRAAAQLLGRK